MFEFNGHPYTGYVKVTRTDPVIVEKHGGSRNPCSDDINFIKEDAEHADVTKEDTKRSGPNRDNAHPVSDHPDPTHERVPKSTDKGPVPADELIFDETCETCGIPIEVGKNSFHCDCLTEEIKVPPKCTIDGEPENGVTASCVKTDTVLLNTNTCDFTTHCTTKVIYYCIGDKRRAHLTHDPVYLPSDVKEGAIYLSRLSEPENYRLSHNRPPEAPETFILFC